MGRYRTINVDLNRQYRNDLNKNFEDIEKDISKSESDIARVEEESKRRDDLIAGTDVEAIIERIDTSANNADVQAQHAKTQGDYAKAQGEYAKTQGEYAQSKGDYADEKAILADEAAGNANLEASNLSQLKIDVTTATQNANTATDNANSATTNANNSASYATTQGDYAKQQADRAKDIVDGTGILLETDIGVKVAGFNASGQVLDKNGNVVEGKVKSVNNISPNTNGNIEIPTAKTDTLGLVKVDGETIKIDQNGVISSVGGSAPIAKIYGVKIDTTNSDPETAVTYTDDAIGFIPARGNNGAFNYGSWQDKFPFNQIKPCLLKNGVVNYYLNPNDYTKKADGTNADIISGNDGDVMIEFPKIYWKIEIVGTNLHIKYSSVQVDPSYVTYKPLAHTRGLIEKDFVYISAYMGNTVSSKLRSLSGKTPTVNQTIGIFRTQAQANGAGYDQMAYYQLLMLQVLFVVMFKNRDSQTALGRGYVDGNAGITTTGGTNTKGLFYGETTGKLQNKFCGIEDFWGNAFYWIDGMFIDGGRNILIGNQSFNDIGSGYKNFGQGATANLSGYISEVQGGTETGFIPKISAGSATTHYADNSILNSSTLPTFGGSWANGDNVGAFRLSANSAASSAILSFSARLLFL